MIEIILDNVVSDNNSDNVDKRGKYPSPSVSDGTGQNNIQITLKAKLFWKEV